VALYLDRHAHMKSLSPGRWPQTEIQKAYAQSATN
jgi:hypothetical protein